jgi:hypothetical protein
MFGVCLVKLSQACAHQVPVPTTYSSEYISDMLRNSIVVPFALEVVADAQTGMAMPMCINKCTC